MDQIEGKTDPDAQWIVKVFEYQSIDTKLLDMGQQLDNYFLYFRAKQFAPKLSYKLVATLPHRRYCLNLFI